MNRYDPRTPRALAGLAAAAITSATLALAVVLPATSLPIATPEDIATRVTSEQCIAPTDSAITEMSVLAERHPHAMPLAESRAAVPGTQS
jgi:hypothetical protein